MRQTYHKQLPLQPSKVKHPRALELAMMSAVLDANPSVLSAVRKDLLRAGGNVSGRKGREGMSAEQALRAALLKQMFDVSYDELSFHLEDSVQLRAFCRIVPSKPAPRKSALQANLSAIRAQTWEAVNKAILRHAQAKKIEKGEWMRTDTTVIESNIHTPLDSSLLWDSVRVLTRIVGRAHEDFGTSSCNHARRAKRRSVAILNVGRMDRRVPLYKDLLKVTHETVRCAEKAAEELGRIGDLSAYGYEVQLRHYLPLIAKVIAQTERRVLRGESVPATEKIVSLFEPHTDIIRKDRRGTYYGHKVTLSTGRSGLILDVVIEKGNPADSTLAVRSTERHAKTFGRAPTRVAFDGGFASKQNFEAIRAAGTREVCFAKPAGVPIEKQTSTPRIRRVLRRFRIGIEAGISFLKRSFGWSRCTWSGLTHFRAYTWCSAVACNLLSLARISLARLKPA